MRSTRPVAWCVSGPPSTDVRRPQRTSRNATPTLILIAAPSPVGASCTWIEWIEWIVCVEYVGVYVCLCLCANHIGPFLFLAVDVFRLKLSVLSRVSYAPSPKLKHTAYRRPSLPSQPSHSASRADRIHRTRDRPLPPQHLGDELFGRFEFLDRHGLVITQCVGYVALQSRPQQPCECCSVAGAGRAITHGDDHTVVLKAHGQKKGIGKASVIGRLSTRAPTDVW